MSKSIEQPQEIIAVCRTKMGFEREIKLPRPQPMVSFPVFNSPQAFIKSELEELPSPSLERINFYFEKELLPGKLLYLEK